VASWEATSSGGSGNALFCRTAGFRLTHSSRQRIFTAKDAKGAKEHQERQD
jgi:hypothetical protein